MMHRKTNRFKKVEPVAIQSKNNKLKLQEHTSKIVNLHCNFSNRNWQNSNHRLNKNGIRPIKIDSLQLPNKSIQPNKNSTRREKLKLVSKAIISKLLKR